MRFCLFSVLTLLSCASETSEFDIQPISQVFEGAEQPCLFTDEAGVTWLSFQQRADTNVLLRITRLNGETWQEPQLIAQGTNWFVNWADYPVVASNGKGYLLAHMLPRSGEGKFAYDVFIAASQDNGKSWSKPAKLHDDTTQTEHGFVSIVPYGNQFFLCWLDGRKTVGGEGHDHHGSMTLRAALVNTNGEKVQEWELDDRVCDCCQTTAAITKNGPVVIYRNRSEDEVRDIFITRYENGSWSEPQPVYPDDWVIHGCPVNGPRCDAQGDNLVVAWFTASGEEPGVYVSFSSDGGKSFDEPVRVDEGKPIGRVDVILWDNQTALVSWMEGAEIMLAHVTRVSKLKTLKVAQTSESRSSGFPQLASSKQGAVLAWTDPEAKAVKSAFVYRK
ncbi:MAG: glycoside hydrolase [Cyclobacteriaceae bacterium]|nr:glycoside hydrolase [Cyclobacteriaceae bacterium]